MGAAQRPAMLEAVLHGHQAAGYKGASMSAVKGYAEREAAMRDILRVIATSPSDYQPVFDAILDSATRLSDSTFGALLMCGDGHFEPVATIGMSEDLLELLRTKPIPIDPALSTTARAAVERHPLQVADVRTDSPYANSSSTIARIIERDGMRSNISVPMLLGERCLGVIVIYRQEVRAFADEHVSMLESFADHAVIAVENVRRFRALERALERQTATAEILRVISHSPTDSRPVFDAILNNAARLCGATTGHLFLLDGEVLRMEASLGGTDSFMHYIAKDPPHIDGDGDVSKSVRGAEVVQVEDQRATELYARGHPLRVATVDMEGIRTQLCVPLRKGSGAIGTIVIYRREVKKFDDKDIELVSMFADQAVIAIENVRLFETIQARTDEVRDALDRQTATSEILRVISHSPTDSRPVFDAILQNSARLCRAPLGAMFLVRNEHLELVAWLGGKPRFQRVLRKSPVPLSSDLAISTSVREGRVIQHEDLSKAAMSDSQDKRRAAAIEIEGIGTLLCVPLRRDADSIGVIALFRHEKRLFADYDVELVSTFADQAVIAIENVRLFQTLEARTAELSRSVNELRALGEVGQAVSSTLDTETVLETIVTQAVALSGADGGTICEYDEATGTLPIRTGQGYGALLAGSDPLQLGEGVMGSAVAERTPVQVPDVDAPGAYTGRLRPILEQAGLKALLAVPLLREERVLGALLIGRNTTGEFPAETVALIETFAAQSAIAIHNARLYAELEAQGRALDAANRHKSEFLANMSHELRTPLNAIIGFSEVLDDELFGELNEKQAEYVKDIHDSGRHLLSLINDILNLSKIEAGHMELDISRFDVRAAIHNAMTLVVERANRRRLKLQSDIDDSVGELTGDERKFKQILLNLLSNAIKFTPEGGEVRLAAHGTATELAVEIHDTGVGMSEAEQAIVFEAFRQAGSDYARKAEGTGLGLTLTRQFVELHGGRIELSSTAGVGSVFKVILPREPVTAEVK